jgi:hypothetical protein
MANKTSSERVSVKSYHVAYLRQVGAQIGTDDLSEVINHVLACLKQGCNGMPQGQALATTEKRDASHISPNSTQTPVDDDALAESLGDLLAA